MDEELIKTIMYFALALAGILILISVLYFYTQSHGLFKVLIG